MGVNKTDASGRFWVQGCAWDLGSDPDPYVKLLSQCNIGSGEHEGRLIILPVNYTFKPKIIDYGRVEMNNFQSTDANIFGG